MKTISILFVFLLTQLSPLKAQDSTSITVLVENIQDHTGEVHFALYTKDNFMNEPGLRASSKIENGTAVAVFNDIPAGIYAVTCFHDQNGNNQMDFEATGRPLESYGVSNNIFNMYGPPTWNDTKFEVSEEPVRLLLKLTR